MQPTLVLRNVSCGHDARMPTLTGIDLALRAGETAVLCGPSGCGKTTLLKTAIGILPPLAGDVEVLGRRLPARPAAGAVGYVPQGLGLVRHVSALRNVLMGSLARTPWLRSATGFFPPAEVDAARRALASVGLAHKADAKPAHMSGGEKRRVALARALAQRPRILFADEILSELDPESRALVIDAVRTLQREHGTTVLLVEHDVETARSLADRLLVVDGGRLHADPHVSILASNGHDEVLVDAL